MLVELARRGHTTIDTDYDGWTLPSGTWDEPRMSAALAEQAAIVVSGTVENQGAFYDRFEHIVLLSAPVDVLIERLSARDNNPYGKSSEDQAEVRRYVVQVEPLLRIGATLELDARRSVSELAHEIERWLRTRQDPGTLRDHSTRQVLLRCRMRNVVYWGCEPEVHPCNSAKSAGSLRSSF